MHTGHFYGNLDLSQSVQVPISRNEFDHAQTVSPSQVSSMAQLLAEQSIAATSPVVQYASTTPSVSKPQPWINTKLLGKPTVETPTHAMKKKLHERQLEMVRMLEQKIKEKKR